MARERWRGTQRGILPAFNGLSKGVGYAEQVSTRFPRRRSVWRATHTLSHMVHERSRRLVSSRD